jgi:hypothetical protein
MNTVKFENEKKEQEKGHKPSPLAQSLRIWQ